MHNTHVVRIIGLYRHYLLSMKRNPARIIEILIWPSFEIMLFALLAASQQHTTGETELLTLTILSGIAYWNFTARIIQESVAQLVDDFTSKNIQNLVIAPIRSQDLLISLTMASATKLLLSLAALAFIIFIVYPAFYTTMGFHVIVWVVQLELVGISLSLFAITAVLIVGERVGFIGWLISTIVQIFSLSFYDREALPMVFSSLSYLVPSSYVFEAIRSFVPGAPVMTSGQVLALLLSLVYMAFGTTLFLWAYRVAKKTGTFSKL